MFKKIIDLVDLHTKYKREQILQCNFVYAGYTNKSYSIKLLDGNKLFVKTSITNHINMIEEGNAIKAYTPELYIYSDQYGVLITHWIEHYQVHDNFWNEDGIALLCHEIANFHKIKIPAKMAAFDYLQYDNVLKPFSDLNNLYHKLIKKWCIGTTVTSHNDINHKNLITTKQANEIKIILIDFEWMTNNYAWWDYVNYLAEQEIYEIATLNKWMKNIDGINNKQDLYELLFIRWWYCLGWAKTQKNILPNLEEYIIKCSNNIIKLVKLLLNVELNDSSLL